MRTIAVGILAASLALNALSKPATGRPVDSSGNPVRMITVSTAAGIDVTVAPDFAAPIQGFIADLVAAGYRPRKINCFSTSHTHVPGSRHFRGLACDFDQHIVDGCDRTRRRFCAVAPAQMRHVAGLTKKWGLRDGCSFGDCGHIDNGPLVTRSRRPSWPRMLETAAGATGNAGAVAQ